MRTIIQRTGLVAMVLAHSAVAIASGHYVDQPGLTCVQRYDGHPYYYGTHARNDSGSEELFYCPIRITEDWLLQDPDTEATVAGLTPGLLAVVAHVEDFSSASNVSCHVKICDPDETSCYNSDGQASSGSTGAVQTLYFDLDSDPDLPIDAGQVAYMYCDVPAKVGSSRSGIVAYTANLTETP